MNDIVNLITQFVIVLFSAILHEIMHGVVAEKFGDTTARDAGRITLNPISHIDPIYSLLMPLVTWFGSGGRFALGGAKPVPININRFSNLRWGMVSVSLAGPLTNIGIAIIAGLVYKFTALASLPGTGDVLVSVIVINLLLGVFNLIPIPPLDGSKVIAAFLPQRLMYQLLELERFGFILLFIFLYSGILDRIFIPVVILFDRLLGLNLFA